MYGWMTCEFTSFVRQVISFCAVKPKLFHFRAITLIIFGVQVFSDFLWSRWSGGAKLLRKLPVPGRPTNLDYSRAKAYCACSKSGWGCLDIFFLSSIASN